MQNARYKKLFPLLILTVAVLLLLFAKEVRAAVLQALSLSVGTVIPGLFPFLVLSEFAVHVSVFNGSKGMQKCTQALFGLPAAAMPCILFGCTGGYLTGAKTALTLYKNGQITKVQAQKLCKFCFSPGLAFAVSTVGSGMLGNTKSGLLLFCCNTLSCLLLGLLQKRDHTEVAIPTSAKSNTPPSQVFTLAVQNSASTCLQLSAWMAIFAALQTILLPLLPVAARSGFLFFTEVSAASLRCVQMANLPLCACVTGFGGLCIFCQLLPDLQHFGLSAACFLRYRMMQAGLSLLFCKIGLLFLPQLGIAQTTALIKAYSVNPTASVFLLLACFIFILDLAPQKKTWYTEKGR